MSGNLMESWLNNTLHSSPTTGKGLVNLDHSGQTLCLLLEKQIFALWLKYFNSN